MSTALVKLADNTGVSAEEIKSVLSGMIISAKAQHGAVATDAELTVVSSICSQYGLNPLTKEAHAFVSGGKLSVMIGIDGWLSIMNRQPTFNGVEFDYEFDGKELLAVTTKIHIKGRDFPVEVTEWMDECFQPKSDAWRKYKKRMLRNKSLGQCIRVAFGISEVIDSDEADRIKESSPAQHEVDITPKTEALNIEKIELEIAQAGDLDTLKSICSGIRKDLEARGIWGQHKSTIIKLNEDQKARIASFNEVVEEAEFEEVTEKDLNDQINMSEENDPEANDPDIAFGDGDDEEF